MLLGTLQTVGGCSADVLQTPPARTLEPGHRTAREQLSSSLPSKRDLIEALEGKQLERQLI